MRGFLRLREVLAANKEFARLFAAFEARTDRRLADQDQAIVEVLEAIRGLVNPTTSSAAKRKIGFV